MQKQTKPNKVIELLENLLLCNRITNQKKKHGILTGGPSKCDVNTLTVHLLESCPHEPTSIMANVQRKLKKKNMRYGYHTVFILV